MRRCDGWPEKFPLLHCMCSGQPLSWIYSHPCKKRGPYAFKVVQPSCSLPEKYNVLKNSPFLTQKKVFLLRPDYVEIWPKTTRESHPSSRNQTLKSNTFPEKGKLFTQKTHAVEYKKWLVTTTAQYFFSDQFSFLFQIFLHCTIVWWEKGNESLYQSVLA